MKNETLFMMHDEPAIGMSAGDPVVFKAVSRNLIIVRVDKNNGNQMSLRCGQLSLHPLPEPPAPVEDNPGVKLEDGINKVIQECSVEGFTITKAIGVLSDASAQMASDPHFHIFKIDPSLDGTMKDFQRKIHIEILSALVDGIMRTEAVGIVELFKMHILTNIR